MSSKVKPSTPTGTVSPAARRYRPLSLVGIGTALVLVTYVTPVATVPQTAAALQAGSGARAWILSSMSVGLAAALLATGAVGDAVGRRRTYVVGLGLLGLGALGCAAAQDSAFFVAARILEGVGGAAVLACGLAVLAAAFARQEERARATAVWGASVGIGISAGAVVAAALGGVGSGWRESYVLLGVVALVLVPPSTRLLPESSAERVRRLDVPGLVTLASSLTLLVSGLTEARSGLSAGVLVVLALSLVLLVVFALLEVRSAAPLIEPALLRSPGFLAATLGSLALGAGIIGMASNLPLLVQLGLGDSLWAATGLVLGWSVTSVATSLVVRRVPIPLSGPATIAVALLVVGLGQLLALGVGADSTAWRLLPSMLVAGLATGVLNAVLGREAVANVPPDRAAMGSGSNNTARYLGAAVGITVFSVLAAHAGSGAGTAKLVDGWSTAVLFSSAVTILGAVLIAAAGWRPARRS